MRDKNESDNQPHRRRGGEGWERLAVAGFFRTRLLKDAARHSTPFPDYIDLNSISFPLVHVTALTPTHVAAQVPPASPRSLEAGDRQVTTGIPTKSTTAVPMKTKREQSTKDAPHVWPGKKPHKVPAAPPPKL